MAKRERLGGVLSPAAAALLTSGPFLKVAIKPGLSIANVGIGPAGKSAKAALEAPVVVLACVGPTQPNGCSKTARLGPGVVPDWSCDP
jgi:hypothetical protein